ncbi:MAG: hypothetical protein CL677_07300 [Bdellovibrionaceae bacterium]|nr:hypothetical protein [Pseudobdellovibrionaceae bacterium]|tara:strand:- start:67470 stop:68471 length:1002 start_codon:yes stop_codon:yes gene_type:complete
MKHVVILLIVAVLSHLAWAEEEALTLQEQASLSDKLKDGWHPKINLGLDLSFSASNSVVGQEDGDTLTIGGSLKNKLIYKKQQSEWRQSLDITGKTAKTPTLPRFVKSADEVKYESLYLYSLEKYPNMGPYVRVSASAPAFFGESVQSEAKTFQVTNTSENLGVGESQRLTDGFKPLTITESVGLFYKYIDRKNTKVDFRVGLGAQQIKADDQLVLDDDSDTDSIIELRRLEDSDTVGLEYGFSWTGQWNKQSEYSFTGQFLTPFGEDIEAGKECEDCDDIELTNVDIALSFTTKMSDWATVKYEYKALKQPKTLNQFQIQHGLVFGITHQLL